MEFEATTLLSGLEYLTLGLITVVSIVLWVRWLGRWKSDKLPLLKSRSRVQSPIGIAGRRELVFSFRDRPGRSGYRRRDWIRIG